jgi:DNA replication and repair protein RecF
VAITELWLADFRCFSEANVQPDPSGLTVLRGPNGAGKTSVLEAIGWLATQRSMRAAPRDVLVRIGAERGIVRAQLDSGGREQWIEAEIPRSGHARTYVNRRAVRRRSELVETIQVTVFSPDDLHLVQGGPAGRRDYLDDVLADRHVRLDALRTEVERILRHRVALLRQASGKLDSATATSLDVWDARLAVAGAELADAREALSEELAPLVSAAYESLAGTGEPVALRYHRSWVGDLGDSLESHRHVDLRRQVTSVGPHRDDLDISIGPRSVRTLASQGEQRSVALALRLATHELRRRSTSEPPLLLLDDVFSELDTRRSEALVGLLPSGQVLLTTALDPPPQVHPGRVVDVTGGTLLGAASR